MKHENTKRMRQAYKEYARATATSLDDVYSSYSSAKMNAWIYCEKLAKQFSAVSSLYIIGHNSQTFSVAFEGKHNGKQAFFYITKTYDRFVYLDELGDTVKTWFE